MSDRPGTPRSANMIFVVIGLAVLSTVGSVVAVIVLAGRGVSQIEAAPLVDARGRAVVRFSNRGTRAGFLCGWVSLSCPGSEKRTLHICAEDVQPGAQSGVTTSLHTGGRTGCAASFLPDDIEVP